MCEFGREQRLLHGTAIRWLLLFATALVSATASSPAMARLQDEDFEIEFIVGINDSVGVAPGYRMVQLEVETFDGKKAKQERRLVVEYELRRIFGERGVVSKNEMVIPVGETSAFTEFQVPVTVRRDWLPEVVIRIFEDDEELQGRFVVSDLRPSEPYFDNSYSCLLVSDRLPLLKGNGTEAKRNREQLMAARRLFDSGLPKRQVLRQLGGTGFEDLGESNLAKLMALFLFPQIGEGQLAERSLLIDYASDRFSAASASALGDFPDSWEQLSTYDAIFISLEDLVSLEETYPEKFEALRDWARTDRMLITDKQNGDLNGVKTIEALFQWSGAEQNGLVWHRTVPVAKQGARGNFDGAQQSGSIFREAAENLAELVGGNQGGVPESSREPSNSESRRQTPRPPAIDYDRQIARGQQIQVESSPAESDASFLLGQDPWHTFILVEHDSFRDVVLSHRVFLDFAFRYYSNHTTRFGYELRGATNRNLDWLVEGYGLPPVQWFQFLITAFVVVIGPLNYALLRYLKRIHLMLFTVPFGAAAICAALFGFTILSDGTSVRSRIISYATVDQVSGTASSWSRESYYTPSAPADGLSFPENTVALPLTSARQNGSPYQVHSDVGRMRFSDGAIRGRTTSQFLVAFSGATPAKLEILSQQVDAMEVVNRFPVELRVVGIVDEEGRVYRAESVAAGQTFTAILDEAVWLKPTLGREVREAAPAYPDGMEPDSGSRSRRTMNDSGLFANMGQLGLQVQELLDENEFPPKSYWLIAAEDPLVTSPAPNSKGANDLHLVRGYW